MAQNGEIAKRWGMHRLCHLQVLHLRIGKRLVNLINRPAGYASVIEQFDPLGAGFLSGHWHDDLHDFGPILGPRSRGSEAGIGDEIRALNSVAKTLVDLIATGSDVDMPILGLEDAGGNTCGMVVPRLRGHLATHQPARRLEVEHGEHGFEQ